MLLYIELHWIQISGSGGISQASTDELVDRYAIVNNPESRCKK